MSQSEPPYSTSSSREALEAEILERANDLRKMGWEYQQKYGHPKFLLDTPVRRIPNSLLENAKIVEIRHDICRFLPPKPVCLEIGTWRGEFAKFLLDKCNASLVVTVDQTYTRFNFKEMQKYVEERRLKTIEGDSSTEVTRLQDNSFDLVYVDGDHSYEGIMKDIETSSKKLKSGGLIVLNDYTAWSPFQFQKYGSVKAVADFALREHWPVVYLALEPAGYHDIAFRKP